MSNPTYTMPDGSVLEIPADIMAELDRLDSLVDTYEIHDDKDVEVVNEIGKRALAFYNALDREKRNAKAPFAKIVDGIDEWARPFLKRMKTTQERAKQKLADYASELQRKRAILQESQRKAEEAAAQQAPPPGRVVAPLLPPAALPELPANIPTREEYDVRYIDPNLIPREFLIPDHEAILDALKKNPKAGPGCELVTWKKVVTR